MKHLTFITGVSNGRLKRARLTILPAGTVKRIHVDRQRIAKNRSLPVGEQLPAITVQTSRGAIKGRDVKCFGFGRMVQSTKPLKCGARVWFETHGHVEVAP